MATEGGSLKQPRELAKDFGICLKLIRETKPRSTNIRRGRGNRLTQGELARRLSDEWLRRTGEYRIIDARWVRKCEHGDILVSLVLAICIADALAADRNEKALLLQAAGYNGVAVVALQEMGVAIEDFQSQVAVCVQRMAAGSIPLSEVLHLMHVQLVVVTREISDKLREHPDWSPPDPDAV